MKLRTIMSATVMATVFAFCVSGAEASKNLFGNPTLAIAKKGGISPWSAANPAFSAGPAGSLKLNLVRVRNDAKPSFQDNGIVQTFSKGLAKGKYKISYRFKGEKVKTAVIWCMLTPADGGKTVYQSKEFKAVASANNWQKVELEITLPSNMKSALISMSFRTEAGAKNAFAFIDSPSMTSVK